MGRRGPKPLNVATTEGVERAGLQSRPPIRLDPTAAREWRRLIVHLTKTHVLAEQELGALAIHCLALSGISACDREIKREGLLIDGRGGVQVKNPLLTARAAYVDQAIKTARELGLTPLTRTNTRPIDANDAENDEIVRRFFSGNN